MTTRTLAARIRPFPRFPAWSEGDRLTREKEALGFYISGHPLDRFRPVVEAFAPCDDHEPQEASSVQPVELACVVTQVARQISRRDSSEWGKILVEDFSGTATILAFKDVLAGKQRAPQSGRRGSHQGQGERPGAGRRGPAHLPGWG